MRLLRRRIVVGRGVASDNEPHGDHEGSGEGAEADEEDGCSTDRFSHGFHAFVSPKLRF
jgi:hypothetical protein